MIRRRGEDLTSEEVDLLIEDARQQNPYRGCSCRNANNDYGICSYCEWEEERFQDEQE